MTIPNEVGILSEAKGAPKFQMQHGSIFTNKDSMLTPPPKKKKEVKKN